MVGFLAVLHLRGPDDLVDHRGGLGATASYTTCWDPIFAEAELPADTPRRGLLGQAAFLALHAHPTTSSATLRGKQIRQRFLCGTVPTPPANLNTGLPEPSPDARTLRERAEVHLTDPGCAACHAMMDPLGLGLETFDGIGRYRETENGAPIDPSGELDGAPFADAAGLGEAVAAHPDLGPCFVRHLYRYAVGRPETPGEEAPLDALAARFEARGHRVLPLLVDLVLSPGFRRLGAPAPEVAP